MKRRIAAHAAPVAARLTPAEPERLLAASRGSYFGGIIGAIGPGFIIGEV